MQESEAPTWLQTGSAPPGSDHSPPPPSAFSLPESASARANDETFNATRSMMNSSGNNPDNAIAEEKELPSVVLFMRLANLGVAGLLIVASIAVMVSLPSLPVWVLSIYATCGGCLVCCLETQLKFLRTAIAINAGFLFSPYWRFMFYFLMASIAWTYKGTSSISKILGPIVTIGLIVVALFNTYVLCRYPSYRQMREKIAEEEDRRIESRISGEVKKQVMNSAVNR